MSYELQLFREISKNSFSRPPQQNSVYAPATRCSKLLNIISNEEAKSTAKTSKTNMQVYFILLPRFNYLTAS